MASPADIAVALLARCATLSIGSPALPVAMPDIVFTPPADGRYLDVKAFFNSPAWQGLAGGKIDQGILQIDVVWPPAKGIVKPMTAAGGVAAHFVAGKRYGAIKVSGDPWAASPIIEDAETRVPVRIPWTA